MPRGGPGETPADDLLTAGFDTATDRTAVAVTRDGAPLSEVSVPPSAGRPEHGRRLLEELERAVEAAGGWREVDRIAVGVGPGSFTGLRIGIATARAIGQAHAIPVAGVSTLAALAAGLAEGGEDLLLAVLDARRGQAFAGLYRGGGEVLWEPWVGDPDILAERVGELDAQPLAAGDGAIRFRALLEAAGARVPGDRDAVHRVEARFVCRLGDEAPAADPGKVVPLYLREPDAARWRRRDSGADSS